PPLRAEAHSIHTLTCTNSRTCHNGCHATTHSPDPAVCRVDRGSTAAGSRDRAVCLVAAATHHRSAAPPGATRRTDAVAQCARRTHAVAATGAGIARTYIVRQQPPGAGCGPRTCGIAMGDAVRWPG